MTRRQHNNMTTGQHDGNRTTQQKNNTTTQQHNNTATQQHNNTTTQQHNNTTTQQPHTCLSSITLIDIEVHRHYAQRNGFRRTLVELKPFSGHIAEIRCHLP